MRKGNKDAHLLQAHLFIIKAEMERKVKLEDEISFSVISIILKESFSFVVLKRFLKLYFYSHILHWDIQISNRNIMG